jgi:hypothetical protein
MLFPSCNRTASGLIFSCFFASLFLGEAMLAGQALAFDQPNATQDAKDVVAYERPHSATLPGKSGRKRIAAVDYLKIIRVSPSEIIFCLDTFADNGNMCNVAGKAVLGEGQVFMYRAGKSADECVLEFHKTTDAWVVTDTTGSCARSLCGAGASIGKAIFLLKNKAKKIRRCESEIPCEGDKAE